MKHTFYLSVADPVASTCFPGPAFPNLQHINPSIGSPPLALFLVQQVIIPPSPTLMQQFVWNKMLFSTTAGPVYTEPHVIHTLYSTRIEVIPERVLRWAENMERQKKNILSITGMKDVPLLCRKDELGETGNHLVRSFCAPLHGAIRIRTLWATGMIFLESMAIYLLMSPFLLIKNISVYELE